MICLNCSTPLTKKQRNNKYCSKSCAAQVNNITRITKRSKYCRNCNTKISYRKTYCNISCQISYNRSLNKSKAISLFQEGKLKSRHIIYKILSEQSNECSVCHINEWNGKPIRLWVDHIDGNATNNKPDNFRLICPNCDSQSPTFGARNKGNGRKSHGLPQYG